MTVSRARVQRAHETETAVARWFAEHGWPYAEPVGAGRNGSDVTGLPGLACEVKGAKTLDLPGWLRQAANGGPGLPFVVYRPRGFGPARVADWPAILRLNDLTYLLREAGYGTEAGS